jgi:deoxyribodipyrimidine photo-lyase
MKVLFWHRRDLRIDDNAGLYHALKEGEVQPVFIFDNQILSKLPANDQRIIFIHQEIERLQSEYKALGSSLLICYGNPVELIPKLAIDTGAQLVYTNRDYEPYARERDKVIFDQLKRHGIDFKGAKDHVIFEKEEVVKLDGLPYTVFTPYSRKWREKLNEFYLKPYPTATYASSLAKSQYTEIPTLASMGFEGTKYVTFPDRTVELTKVNSYHTNRDIPSVDGTTRLSLHLRFGTISIRELARMANQHNATYLNELIWRDFYQMIIFHFPHSATNSFKKQYDAIPWENNEIHFQAWCEGKTGYPLVDAGMRELNATGFMHNRIRMVVASFLTKHLLLDWRLGETYFAEKLLDFELASNSGGWQWAAGSGCDAAPYFRVFNPTSQQEKFDKNFSYIKKWVPEFGTPVYPPPIVEHKFARERAIERYKNALKSIEHVYSNR